MTVVVDADVIQDSDVLIADQEDLNAPTSMSDSDHGSLARLLKNDAKL